MHRITRNALFIVDGSYLLYRSFYALQPLYNSVGIPTQATFGFCRAIKKLIDDHHPSHIVIVWDSRGKTFRSDMYADYKATRQKPPSDLFVQKEYIIKFLDAIKMAHTAQEGYEADDVIAGLIQRTTTQQTVLVCPDKDMYQLLSPNLLIIDPFKNRIIDEKNFVDEQGFGAEKIPFYYALLGDASDNIPGVAGIGKKTAQELVTQFASLDDLYHNINRVAKERTRKFLSEQKENAYLSLKLFTLKPPPQSPPIADLAFDAKNWSNALDIFKELEFSSLVKSIEQQRGPKPLAIEQNTSLHEQVPAEQVPWRLVTVQDMPTLDAMIDAIKQAGTCALDTETTGYLPLIDKFVGISFAHDATTAYYIPLGHETIEPQLDMQQVMTKLKTVLEDPSISVVMHNAKFDQLVLWNNGISIMPVNFDTLLAANLVRNEWQKINLKDLSTLYLHEPMKKFKDIIGKHKTFATVPLAIAAEYGAHDALQTFKLKPILEKELARTTTLQNIFDTIDMPFYWILVRMEQMGILIDPEKLRETGKILDQEIATLEAKIFAALENKKEFSPAYFNLNSPKQVERLLFDELKLPVVKKSSKGQRSTDQEVLQELSALHPIPGMIIQYRELTKLKNTYVDPLPEFINPTTKRIHTNYSQTLVATGRLSSSDPNLQNIPAGEGFGIGIRSAFIAPEGTTLLSADYSQIELRILAHLSQDAALIDIFKHDHDIHLATAAQLFGIPADQITNQQRQLGKRINFSIIYGMSPFGLARDLGIKQSEAKSYIETYFSTYPGVSAWMDSVSKKAIACGYSETVYGRRRYIPELREKNRSLFEAGKRIAINSPVQGTQADIMKIAMINIDHLLMQAGLQSRMVLQIHDEMILEVIESEREQVASLVRREMESVVAWEVPLKVTMRWGKTWADITK